MRNIHETRKPIKILNLKLLENDISTRINARGQSKCDQKFRRESSRCENTYMSFMHNEEDPLTWQSSDKIR